MLLPLSSYSFPPTVLILFWYSVFCLIKPRYLLVGGNAHWLNTMLYLHTVSVKQSKNTSALDIEISWDSKKTLFPIFPLDTKQIPTGIAQKSIAWVSFFIFHFPSLTYVHFSEVCSLTVAPFTWLPYLPPHQRWIIQTLRDRWECCAWTVIVSAVPSFSMKSNSFWGRLRNAFFQPKNP